jgi:F-type H+-transporting ATPase subunit b
MLPLRKINTFITTAGLALYAMPVMAAEGSAEEAGLPQFDTSLFPAQLFWLALTFVALYLLMSKVALPGVKRTLDQRSTTLSSDLKAAEAANEAAKAMITQYEKALTDARAKAQATVSEITAAAAKASAESQTAQQRELSKRLHDAEAKIGAAKNDAIKNIGSAAQDLAGTIVEKVSGMKGAVHG